VRDVRLAKLLIDAGWYARTAFVTIWNF
jgi:hypothetical protein